MGVYVGDAAAPSHRRRGGWTMLVGESGDVVHVVSYVDRAGRDRRMYRLHIDGALMGEFKTPNELGSK
jgi:hypothetical protein